MKISQSELEQYLSKAAWILKGPVDASDFKSYIFPLLFFKRISSNPEPTVPIPATAIFNVFM